MLVCVMTAIQQFHLLVLSSSVSKYAMTLLGKIICQDIHLAKITVTQLATVIQLPADEYSFTV